MTGLQKHDARRIMRRNGASREKLDRLFDDAVRVLTDNMGGGDAALRQRAAEFVVTHVLGRPRQQSEVTVNVSNPAQAHYDALQTLVQRVTAANTNTLISFDNSGEHDKLSIKHAPVIEGELIPLPPNSADKSTG